MREVRACCAHLRCPNKKTRLHENLQRKHATPPKIKSRENMMVELHIFRLPRVVRDPFPSLCALSTALGGEWHHFGEQRGVSLPQPTLRRNSDGVSLAVVGGGLCTPLCLTKFSGGSYVDLAFFYQSKHSLASFRTE